jgi:hypothetical protein
MWDAASAQLTATLREASLPTAARQHLRKSIVDFVGGRSSIFASLTSTSSFAMRMRVEWAGVGARTVCETRHDRWQRTADRIDPT